MEATLTPMYIDEHGKATPLEGRALSAVRTVMQFFFPAQDASSKQDVRLTTGQAAEIVGTSSKTIARLIDSGQLPGSRVGNGYRTVMLSDLLAFERDAKLNAKANLQKMRDLKEEAGWYSDESLDAQAAYLDSLA